MTQPNDHTGSVGKVQTRTATLNLPAEGLVLEGGGRLPRVDVAYETYGRLTPNRDNAVFVCHALSGDAHVAGYHETPAGRVFGWWDEMVGPGKGIDTDYYFVICANILGGCRGTTGPGSPDPRTGRPYGSRFPEITVGDIVQVHRRLLEQLGIARLAAVVGGSFGGMQVLEWVIRHPETVERGICIASAASLSAQALAFDIVGRSAITGDPAWQGGDYHGTDRRPDQGLAQARKIGHITYLSREMMSAKFGREKGSSLPVDNGAAGRFQSRFQVESYLDHQGRKFVGRFDANSYLHITRAMDEFDLVERFGSLRKAFAPVQAKMLIVALSSDWLFPPEQSTELANALLLAGKRVSCCKLHAPHGHDAFLVDIEHLSEALRAFMPWVRCRNEPEDPESNPRRPGYRREHEAIAAMIRPGSTVLDLGCGDGELLALLAAVSGASGIGVDIDIRHVIRAIDRGYDVFQGDIDAGLAAIPDGAFDCAVLSETLQVVRRPRFVLREMLRVAREVVVSFPNFGKWSHRACLCAMGRMPKNGALPFAWYETPNIHLFTLRDFVELCRVDGIRIRELVCLPAGRVSRLLLGLGWSNLAADRVLARLVRGEPGGNAGRTRCRPWRAG